MKKNAAIKKLMMLKVILAQYGVVKIGLFGSTVRELNTDKSDVDILIDFQDEKETYNNYISVCDIIEKSFGKQKIDIVTLKGLSPFVKNNILNEIEYV